MMSNAFARSAQSNQNETISVNGVTYRRANTHQLKCRVSKNEQGSRGPKGALVDGVQMAVSLEKMQD